MKRTFAWLLILTLLALSGPVQAASWACALDQQKSLYGAKSRTVDKQYYLTDIQGSTLGVADDTGKIIATWAYSDYGETTQTSGDKNLYQPFLYTGQELDAETGWYHNRARHYAPKFGKFLARDTLGSSNSYQYCNGDPVNLVDPTGWDPTDPTSYDPHEADVYLSPHGFESLGDYNAALSAAKKEFSASGKIGPGGIVIPDSWSAALTVAPLIGPVSRLAMASRAGGLVLRGRFPYWGQTSMAAEDFEAAKAAYASLNITIVHDSSLGAGCGSFLPTESSAIMKFGDKIPSEYLFAHETGHAELWMKTPWEEFQSYTPFVHEFEAWAYAKPIPLGPVQEIQARAYLNSHL